MTSTPTARLAASANFAQIETVSHDEQILSSHLMWEDRILLLGDDISPDLLPAVMRRATHALLEESARRCVALDWSSLKMHIHRTDSTGEHTLVTRVDTL